MKFLTSLVLVLFLIVSGTAKAQSSMKNPVTFHLKNGITLIVAENTGFGKVYASVDKQNSSVHLANLSVSDQLDEHLNSNAKRALVDAFGQITPQTPKITFAENEANLASNASNFEQVFAIMAATIQHANCDSKEVDHLFRKQFLPSNMVITIAGGIKPGEAKKLVDEYFGHLQDRDYLATY